MTEAPLPHSDSKRCASCAQPESSGAVTAAVVVAHPDDETLWAGGTILARPKWQWFIVTLCRASDPDRSPRFPAALKRLGATGLMADLDDAPDLRPIQAREVEETILSLLGGTRFDLILTHGPRGEYTTHLRHEETSKTVTSLWTRGKIRADRLWLFAYEDGGKRYLPRAETGAHVKEALSDEVWREKYRIITEIYGFEAESFEARTTPREEAFWCFDSHRELQEWMGEERGRFE